MPIAKITPALRFPEFKEAGEWEYSDLKNLGRLISGLTYSPTNIRKNGLLVLRSSNILNGSIALNDCVYVTSDIKGASLSKPNDILICVRNGSTALIGKNAIIPEGMPLCTHGAFMTVFRAKAPQFVYQLFQTQHYKKQVSADLGARINSINNGQLIKYRFPLPTLPEQQKIADCLGSLDELIDCERQKLTSLKNYKKGLMQQLFPAENETTPRLRFPEFKTAPTWQEKTLGDVLDYEQPTSYIVETTDYKDDYDIPVLTANKSFILGYTNEQQGIYKKTPVIIFDDFTTDKKYVDFSFKVKSSAIKILKAKAGDNIRVIFELMNNIKFNAVEHKRHYISEYQNLEITLPKKEEQQKIADCLSSLDDAITAQQAKRESLAQHKKALMQQLFPTLENI